jgi:hypothetical protein
MRIFLTGTRDRGLTSLTLAKDLRRIEPGDLSVKN